MLVQYCTHCQKAMPMNETLNVQGRRFCPKCKRGTQVLKPEQLKLSADYLLTRGQESEDVTAGYTGRSQSYKNPSIDPMIIACLDALDRDPDDIDTYLTLAKLYYARESPRQAFYYADQGLTYSPNHEGLNDFVNRYLSKEAMEAAVDGGLDSHEDPNDVYRLAVLALQNGETLHAQELLEKTVELDFDHSGAHQALAELYLEQGEYRAAIRELNVLKSHEVHNPYLHFNLGIACAKDEDYKRALSCFKEAHLQCLENAELLAEIKEAIQAVERILDSE